MLVTNSVFLFLFGTATLGHLTSALKNINVASNIGDVPTTTSANCSSIPSYLNNEFSFVGSGRCVNADGLVPLAHVCNGSASTNCTTLGTVETCAAQCVTDDGCTGFELRFYNGVTSECRIFFSSPSKLLPWVIADNGTQLPNSSRITVVEVAALPPFATSVSSCCYRRAYPRPCPLDMPIRMPPKQSQRATEIFNRMAARAANASIVATPALTALVDFCAANATSSSGLPLNLFSADECPGIADLTANGSHPTGAQILERFQQEMLAMEFAHGFAPMWDGWGCLPTKCLGDATQLLNPAFPVLLNLYQPLTLGLNGSSPGSTAGRFTPIMRDIFGCDEFPGKTSFTYNFTAAAERITYTAANYVRGPIGNIIPDVGTFNAVLRPSYVRDMMLITPYDSYHYEGQFPKCTSWPNCTVGTVDNALHILLAWATGGGPSLSGLTPNYTPTTCAAQMQFLRYVVCALSPTWNNQTGAATTPIYYFEADPLGMVRYPEGVKLITASFADLFGTWYGGLLRDWCRHWGWVLAWVLHSSSVVLDPRRLLDPQVLPATSVNITGLSSAVQSKFEVIWTAANASRASPSKFTEYEQVWKAFVNETQTPTVSNLLTWNIGVRDCQDYDNCFGLSHSTGTCVCYVNQTKHAGKQ